MTTLQERYNSSRSMISIGNDSILLEVLKWVGLAFAAGFIGYFGRHLALTLIRRISRKTISTEDPHPSQTGNSNTTSTDSKKEQNKLNKKIAKAEAKKAKKASGL